MDDILLAVNAAFTAKAAWFTSRGLIPPRLIDFYMGQPENPEEFEFVLPALFMDYSVSWKMTGQYYGGPATLMFHALPDTAAPTENISARQAEGLQTTVWYRLVRQVLDTVTGENFQQLIRGQEHTAATADFRYHIMDYGTQVSEIPGQYVDKFTDGSIEEINITGDAKGKFSA
ncbi:hypothetical protein [uncultured Mucilaginibacter sp.]|uniref:hypothetical protein n=1 Tax=uncultured Mucilaginibacter sp. TaxID=797541 RepID=UPI0025D30A4C|nr:hypothetical protein [uncultured Mucilaginibacter sp.]